MPQAVYDGVSLNVDIPSTGGSVITMDAQEDFYEPWKDFLRDGAVAGNGDNRKFPQAFRPIAGDDVVTGTLKYAGLFFLRNDLGWRFRLPDEDVTLILTGNLALENTTLPFFRSRTGRTGAILGLANFVTGVEALKDRMTDNWQLFGNDLDNPVTRIRTSPTTETISVAGKTYTVVEAPTDTLILTRTS